MSKSFTELFINSIMKYFKEHPRKATVWGMYTGLGFYRGVQSQKFMVDKDNQHAQEMATIRNNEYKPEKIMYSKCILHGLFGGIVYNNLFFMPVTISKEVYRLEINLRNIEDGKKTEFYNSVLF